VAFDINLTRKFSHLGAAPIVEAVVQWQARATHPWEAESLRQALADALPGFPKAELQHRFEITAVVPLGNDVAPSASRHETWNGVRLESADGLCIAKFTGDGLVFSRLRPYEDWERFTDAARQSWRAFVKLGAPTEIQRLGVRFINRIEGVGFGNAADYLKEPPTFSADLALSGFFYQSTFDVPGNDLAINVVKTIQPAIPGQAKEPGLIIDIDVFTKKPLPCDDSAIDELLPKMRWLKNMVFFELLTPKSIERFK